MTRLLVATGNRHKTEEIQAILGESFKITDLTSHPDFPEVEESGVTFLENATLKAVEISRRVSDIVLSDDSGLEVDALNGAPGVYSARFAGEDASDDDNNTKLLMDLKGKTQRTARFKCVMVLAKEGKVLAHFEGAVEGRILDAPRGDTGFGYDPLFVPDGFDLSFAELGQETKNGLSHRARAMEQVAQWLRNNSNNA